MSTARRPFEIRIPLEVRTYDIDFAGIVSNIVYVRWLEDLRLELLKQHLPLDQQMAQQRGPVLVSTHIEYKRPVRLFDDLRAAMWVTAIGASKFTLAAEFRVGETITTTAEQVTVFIDLKTFRPVAVPDDIRAAYATMTHEDTGQNV